MMFDFLKKLFRGKDEQIREYLSRKALVLDVRTTSEYKSGHVQGSLHIPLDQLPRRVKEVARKGQPVVTCCASGRRSGMAADILRQAGVEAFNGGPWHTVDRARRHMATANA
jgi:phage shock protein E